VSELVAVNVLLEPDAATKVLATELNAELRRRAPAEAAGVSGGAFSFDTTHLPHVTLLQRYVRRADLPRVFEAVGEASVDALPLVALSPSEHALGTPSQGGGYVLHESEP
jgi:hypothetical protein